MHVVVFPSGVGINSMTISAICALATLSGSALGAASTCKLNAAGCCDFSGEWCNHQNGDGIMYVFEQPTGTCVVNSKQAFTHCYGNATVSGDTLNLICHDKHKTVNGTERATLALATPQDELQWHDGALKTFGSGRWYRGGNTGNYSCRTNRTMF